MADKIKVYLFSCEDYEDLVFTDLSGITEWIEADAEGVTEESFSMPEDFEYTIKIAFLTQEEIDNASETD